MQSAMVQALEAIGAVVGHIADAVAAVVSGPQVLVQTWVSVAAQVPPLAIANPVLAALPQAATPVPLEPAVPVVPPVLVVSPPVPGVPPVAVPPPVPVVPLLLPPQPWNTKTCAKSAIVPQNGAIRFVIVVIDPLAVWCIWVRSFGELGVHTSGGWLTQPWEPWEGSHTLPRWTPSGQSPAASTATVGTLGGFPHSPAM